jgi:hypothetical protein
MTFKPLPPALAKLAVHQTPNNTEMIAMRGSTAGQYYSSGRRQNVYGSE